MLWRLEITPPRPGLGRGVAKRASFWRGIHLPWALSILLGGVAAGSSQTYQDNQTIASDQDTTLETRRSVHFREYFGHENYDTGLGGMSEWLAQGNLQQCEWIWYRWVVEDGLMDFCHAINNTTPPASNYPPMPGNYRANFWFLMTEPGETAGGSYNGGDAHDFMYAMDNPGLCAFDPYSGTEPHEWGDCWWATAGGFNGTVLGNLDECFGNYLMLQWLNTYPQAPDYLANGRYYPIHGRDYFNSWPIFEEVRDNPTYGYPFINAVFNATNATPDQQVNEYFVNRMIRLDFSPAPDHQGAINDLWGETAKRLVTWDFQRQPWLAQANRQDGQGNSDPGSAWNFSQCTRTSLVTMPGQPGWYRPCREDLPMEFGWNIIPLQATPGATVTCNFQPVCDPVRNSDWRACLVALSTNVVSAQDPYNYASYSGLWNCGANSMTLSADQTQLYLVVVATPRGIGTETMVWNAYLTFAGSQFPYTVSFTNTSPLNLVFTKPSGVAWHSHTNTADGTICGNLASGATVASTAYVGTNAMVLDSAQVLGNAQVLDYAVVRGSAVVQGTAVVSGHAVVQDTAQISGHGKVRDWGWVSQNNTVSGNAKVIEHAVVGDSGDINLSGSAVAKGTSELWTTSPSSAFSGCIICEGDTANGGTGSDGVLLGWGWGPQQSVIDGLTNNNWQYCGLTFEPGVETNDAVFALDQYGINHGFLMNGCLPAVDAGSSVRGGYVLPLNGANQYVELPNSVNDFNDTTIAVWFKWAGGAANQMVWSLGDGNQKMLYLTPADGATGDLLAVITDGKTTNVLNGGVVSSNVWTQAAVVFTGTNATATLYVNGAAAATNSGITLFPDSLNAPLMANANYLGRGNSPTNNYFQGSLDEFRVYMRSLAASEVLARYNLPAPAAVTPATDPNPPSPNPATWLANPAAVSDSAITMSATPGTNLVTGWVQYYFACTSGGGHDSGWVSFNKYTDCGLTPGTTYAYTVKMRNEAGMVTAISPTAGATTLISSAGTAGFAYGPVGVTNGQITMAAVAVTNASGKTEYLFSDRTDGKTSGWQASPSWTETGLTTGGTYAYTVQVRDGRGNQSAASAAAQAKAEDDAAPQFPSFVQGEWQTLPYATISNTLSMTAATATDPSGVQYFFHCASGNGPDSGWQSSPTYQTPVLTNGSYSYEYMLRDQSPRTNQSANSTIYTGTITPTSGYHACALEQLTSLTNDDLVTFLGIVVAVGATNYVVQATNSSAMITVWPNTSGEATVSTLAFDTVNVSGHLYTFTNQSIGQMVTYASLTPVGNQPYGISGMVTNAHGAGVGGAIVYFSKTTNASLNPAGWTVADANGNYTQPIINGTWQVCAAASNYVTSPDQVAVVNSANVTGVNLGLQTEPVVNGRVTDLNGLPIAGATVAFAPNPNAFPNALETAITDTNGKYARVVSLGTVYVAAGASNYLISADQAVPASLNGVYSNVDFALTPPWPRVVPQPGQLLFSTIHDALPLSGTVNAWPAYYPAGGVLRAVGSPTAVVTNGIQWESNQTGDNPPNTSGDGGEGFRFTNATCGAAFTGNDSAATLAVNGGTIVTSIEPIRTTNSDPYNCVVSVLLGQFALGVQNDNGYVWVSRGTDIPWNYGTGIYLPNGAPVVLSVVVQPTGQIALFTNSVQAWSTSGTYGFTNLTAQEWWGVDVNVGRGWEGDAWSSFNGRIGDVFVYTNALSNSNRLLLESNLLARISAHPTWTIMAGAGFGGGILPQGAVTVLTGANQAFTMASSANYALTNVVVDGISQGPISSYTFTNVLTNHAITAGYAPITHTITATAGPNGSINPSGTVVVNQGASQTFTFTPSAGYMVTNLLADGISVALANSYTFVNVQTNHTLAVAFGPHVFFTISAAVGPNGWVSPAGNVPVQQGWNQAFAISANNGGAISNVLVDGAAQGAISAYTFTNVQTSHNLAATFAAGPAPVVWYKFDEDTGITASDSSGNGWNASLIGGATWSAGRFGNSVDLNGDSEYLSCPANLVASWSNFTVSAWVYLNANNTWNRLFDFGTGTTVYMFLSPLGGSGVVRYAITTGGNGAEQQINGTAALPTGSWQHVAVTQQGTTGILYVNGAAVGTNASLSLNPHRLGSTANNYIGKSQFSDPCLDGLVDEFRIYPAALTAAQVQAIYGSDEITASAGANGSISPNGVVLVTPGTTQNFSFTAANGFAIASVVVDGLNQGATNAYTFWNVATNHALSVVFASLTPPVLAAADFTMPRGVPTFSVNNTIGGHAYSLMYKNNLTDATWVMAASAAGNGGTISLSDPTPVAGLSAQRFYRIEVQ